jgi:tetratricopeptide (TPR) repeat protein
MNSLVKLFFLLCFFFFYTANVEAQKIPKEEKRILKKARKDLANEKYVDAQAKYLKLISLNPNNDVYNFETGLSYYFSNFQRGKSVSYFEAALKNSSEDTIPELKYYLGRAYHLNGQYEASKNTLTEFTSLIKQTKAGQDLLKETNYRIQLNNNGLKYSKSKNNNIKITNLGTNINTIDREYAPVFRKKDNVILFTSRRKTSKGKTAHDLLAYEDIYAAKKTGADSWSLIENNDELNKYLPKGFNTKKHDAGIIYSSDGQTLYTYKKDKLWKSIFKDNEWTELSKLGDNVNESQFNVPSISVTQDGKTMFFVTTKKDGFGGKDIYKSTKDANGNWGSPENLGAEINTEFDEDAPFLSNDGKILYFSSKGHDGIGGYDIFKSEFIDGKLSKPVNMGIPLNSPVNDIYLVIDEKNEIGFFSSDREGGFGGMDIFGFDLSCPNIDNTEIRGIVYNKTDQRPLQGKLSLYSLAKNETINETSSLAANGKFLMTVPPENEYKLTVHAAGFNPQTININLPKQCEYFPLFTEIALEKIEKDGQQYQVATLRNSFYNSNDALANAQENGITLDTSAITKTVPLNKTPNDNDYKHDLMLLALSRTIDTANTSLNYSIISDTIQITTPISDTGSVIFTYYQEFFGYNIKDVNVNHPDYIELVNKAVSKAQTGATITINIESSASRVPTKTYNTNINLASLRGDEAKKVIIKSLTEKGINKDKIVVNSINSIVSGPKYSGDYKNTKKYINFQYVKITIN